MVNQLGTPMYFLSFSCADQRWEELPYIVNKSNNLGLIDEELKNLSCQERCSLLNNNPVLVARHFQYKVFSTKKILMVLYGKQNIMFFVLNFEKEVAHMSIHSYGI